MDAEQYFPFPSYREYQKESLEEALYYLGEGKNVILDLPTGIGKSPILVALARAAGDAYYTTPQRELRLQLKQDDVLRDYFKVLEARADLVCSETGDPCDECDFYTEPGLTCNDSDNDCTYMHEIGETVVNDIAVLTMSRLLISGQKEFTSYLNPRDLLLVDEAHSLEDQTAGMHANIKINTDTIPDEIFRPVLEDLESPDYEGDEPDPVLTNEEIHDEINAIRDRINAFVDHNEGDPEYAMDIRDCKALMSNMKHFFEEIRDDKEWVVNVLDDEDPTGIEIKPTSVDTFLRRYFWSQGDQIVLASATIPYRGHEDRWLDQLGLDPDTFEIIRYPSPFPPLNRQIHTRAEIGKMSQHEEDLWGKALQELNQLADKHAGTNGLIHTASYDRAEQLVEDSYDWDHLNGNIIADESGESKVEEWQLSNCDILASPSLTEGVDLEGDRCRWQVLLKVPYPHPSDARVQYMLQNDRWHWYMQKGAVSIQQSVGRAVRSKEDKADFYVFDSSFEDVRRSVTFPDWFAESIC